MELGEIVEAIRSRRVVQTKHARKEVAEDNLEFEEVYFSVQNGEILVRYPYDAPLPSCLIAGHNALGEAIHSVWV